MDEPLVDGVSLAVVALGLLGAWLRRAESRWLSFGVSQLLLLAAVGVLVSRWVRSATSLPIEQTHDAQNGSLMVCCGLGLWAAIEMVLSTTCRRRLGAFVIACLSATVALLICEALLAALMLITTGVLIVAGVMRFQNSTDSACDEVGSVPRESGVIALACGAGLLLSLGTWNHAVERETMRPSRSPRFSAWPRATALKDAWQRTAWLAKPGDSESVAQTDRAARREHRLALVCCGALFVVAIGRLRAIDPEESDDAR